jgi:hypothetical protein
MKSVQNYKCLKWKVSKIKSVQHWKCSKLSVKKCWLKVFEMKSVQN